MRCALRREYFRTAEVEFYGLKRMKIFSPLWLSQFSFGRTTAAAPLWLNEDIAPTTIDR
jgi:hypothetical protein